MSPTAVHSQVNTIRPTGHTAPQASQASLELIRAELRQSGYTVDDQTLESAQRFISGQLAWSEFLSQANFDNLPAELWEEWAR